MASPTSAPPPPFTLEELLGQPPPALPEEDPIGEDELALLQRLASQHFFDHRPEPSSFPAQALRAMELVQQPDVDVRQLTALVAQDPALGARVLRVANSAVFNRGNPVSDIRSAITRLGIREVTAIVVGLAGQALFDPTAQAEYKLFTARWNGLFHHAMTSAMGAAQLAVDLHRGHSPNAFMGGLFHDIGKSIALRSICAIVLSGKTRLHPEDPAIDRLLEGVHVEVGTEMHSTWNLPESLRKLCHTHHDDVVPGTPENYDVHLVRVASGFATLRVEPNLSPQYTAQISQSLHHLGLGLPLLAPLRKRLDQHAERVTTMYQVADPAVALRAQIAQAAASAAEVPEAD